MHDLTGAVVIVTGGSRGIGKGCALELAAAGATVYVTARTVGEGRGELTGSLEATVAEIQREGGRAVGVECDHADDEQVAASSSGSRLSRAGSTCSSTTRSGFRSTCIRGFRSGRHRSPTGTR